MCPKRKHATCDSKYLATTWRKLFSPHWAQVCDVSYDQFFYCRVIFKTIQNMKNNDFRQKQHFL